MLFDKSPEGQEIKKGVSQTKSFLHSRGCNEKSKETTHIIRENLFKVYIEQALGT
jgi:hypothetical protein